jgi:hypothetical protein
LCTRAVGGLAHFFEEEGIPTTQISLVRLHTEIIKPPRALWVPFEMGRPLGVPNNPSFQKRVLLAALDLLEAASGPILEDFPEDAPAVSGQVGVLSCPVDFGRNETDLNEKERLCAALKREMRSIRPWYDRGVKQRGRTTVGVSGLDLEHIPGFICAFLDADPPDPPRDDISLPYTLNLATDDLKAFYLEAITSQPGQESLSSKALSDWFWGETVAGKALLAIREHLQASDDIMMKRISNLLIVPIDQAHRGLPRRKKA